MCPSFRSFICLSIQTFFWIVGLIAVVKNPYEVVWQLDFLAKKFSLKNEEKGPKIGFDEFMEKFGH